MAFLDFTEMEFQLPSQDDIDLSQFCEDIDAFNDLSDYSLSQTVNKYEVGESHNYGNFDMNFSDPVQNADSEMTSSSHRFIPPISDEYVKQLLESQENRNTKKNTAWSLGVFDAWRCNRNSLSAGSRKIIVPSLHDMTADEMNLYLGRFVVEARKKDSSPYPPKSLYLIICGLLRSLRDNGIYDKNFLDLQNVTFAEFRKILDARMKELVTLGFGTSVKQAAPIMPEDEQLLWEKNVFGNHTAEALQWTVFFYACKLFGLRGFDEHHSLQCEQFNVSSDSRGKYIEFTGRDSKTFKGGLKQREINNKNCRHYCTEGARCIADYFQMYIACLGGKGQFYRRPLAGPTPRYGEQPVGINKLKTLMKRICEKAGMSGQYSNHSGKRTCATQLYMAGVDEQDIMNRTGHRSERAVRKYKTACPEVQKKVSSVLDPPQPLTSRKRAAHTSNTSDDNLGLQSPSFSKQPCDSDIGSSIQEKMEPMQDIPNRPYFSHCNVTFNFK